MHLVTSGCSFSDVLGYKTWPQWLAEIKGWNLTSYGMLSQGNGLISRSIIYGVDKLLSQGHDANDLIIGIMWSGPDRFDFYNPNVKYDSNINGWRENPTGFIQGDKNWIITNSHWKTDQSRSYYKTFHNLTGSMIMTLENILRTQWFLEKHNIKYFMTTYKDIWFSKNSVACQHLYSMLDMTRFIPIKGCLEWLQQKDYDGILDDTYHPTDDGHQLFTEGVILPYIETLL